MSTLQELRGLPDTSGAGASTLGAGVVLSRVEEAKLPVLYRPFIRTDVLVHQADDGEQATGVVGGVRGLRRRRP
ncbi:hypothetical protein MF672_030875 [Actinomadura sp. ATCC 31491]|uniref:Uncharacterized protein n=1 Tax=Actinomadura luzonensis TaxID=2805427 RepID=A0ABT0G234_9ACTN|nr:hypothetical protein [Actinomadura luzonensis]MCK2218161.1 hypothetical protein [Actinomadura luzonensis]